MCLFWRLEIGYDLKVSYRVFGGKLNLVEIRSLLRDTWHLTVV